MKRHFLLILTMSFALQVFSQQTDSFTDERDGKTYKIVTIGNQIWMAENLAFKIEQGGEYTYDNNQEQIAKYGYLYNWGAAQIACPQDWRLPSRDDFKTLLDNVGGKGKVTFQALLPDGSSGYSASFGGWIKDGTKYKNIEEYGLYWSSSAANLSNGLFLSIDRRFKIAGIFSNGFKWYGYSVRCVKDK